MFFNLIKQAFLSYLLYKNLILAYFKQKLDILGVIKPSQAQCNVKTWFKKKINYCSILGLLKLVGVLTSTNHCFYFSLHFLKFIYF